MSRPLAPCGTVAAYNRHLRHREPPCEPCSTARRAYARAHARASYRPRDRSSLQPPGAAHLLGPGRRMSTSTLERIDLEQMLTQAPQCETRDCDQAATHRIRWVCGCLTLVCPTHLAKTIEFVTDQIPVSKRFRCDQCKRITGTVVVITDLMTVVPL